nr:MAG TPA: hypothetical protein [Caudoviricetes sp.]
MIKPQFLSGVLSLAISKIWPAGILVNLCSFTVLRQNRTGTIQV